MLQLMSYAKDQEGNRISIEEALHRSKGGEYYCECCGRPVQATKGEKKTWHFKHVNGECTDKWGYEDCGSWHKTVQRTLAETFEGTPEAYITDKSGNSHRTDVYIPTESSTIIEIQHSPIQSDDFAERNSFYKDGCGCRVVWIFDKIKAYETGLIANSDDYDAGEDVYYKTTGSGRFPSVDDSISDILVLAQIKQCNKDEDGYDLEDDIFSRVVFADGSKLVLADDDISSLSDLFQYIQNKTRLPKKHFCDLKINEHDKKKHEELPEKDTNDNNKNILDEARCEDTPDERLIEIAENADESVAEALLRNKKAKPSRGDLFYDLVGILMNGLNYGTGEAIVKHLEEIPDEDIEVKESLCNQIYNWSVENEELCVSKGYGGSYIRAYIAKHTTNPSVLSKLLKNTSPGIRKTAVENPYSDKEDVVSLYNDTDVHVRKAVLKKYADAALRLEREQAQREKQELERAKQECEEALTAKTTTAEMFRVQAIEQAERADEFQKLLIESSKNVSKLERGLSDKEEEYDRLWRLMKEDKRQHEEELKKKNNEIRALQKQTQEYADTIKTIPEILQDRGTEGILFVFNIEDHSKYLITQKNVNKAITDNKYFGQKENYDYGKEGQRKFLDDEYPLRRAEERVWICCNN